MNQDFKDKLLNIVLAKHAKEYACHIQYVIEIGVRLAKQNGVDPETIEIACLLHDIGRDNEMEGENHAQAGNRLAKDILADAPLSEDQKDTILSCILNHNSDTTPETIAEQIVRSADAGSKVEFHEAFVLMCKKTTYEERLAWSSKYLEKGYSKISFETYKETLKEKYGSLHAIYGRTLETIQNVSRTR